MRLWSFVGARYEDGSFTGVPRFDHELRRVFPDIQSVTKLPAYSLLDPKEDIVITDNHKSLQVPDSIKTVVVHHGCARTHWKRDPSWRTMATELMCRDQATMFNRPNRTFVAPSRWVLEEFKGHYDLKPDYATLIPSWVPTFGPVPKRNRFRPVVIGDWRDENKGSVVIEKIRAAMPDVEFRRLDFAPEGRERFYLDADLYLCLSVSDGAPYAVADAEACGLPIVTTNVGWLHEFRSLIVVPWELRAGVEMVSAIRDGLARKGGGEGFFETYTFDVWADKWRTLVERVHAYG